MSEQNNVIPFVEPKQQERKCSFCKKKESEVKSLIKSSINDHCICSDCIKHASQRLTEPV